MKKASAKRSKTRRAPAAATSRRSPKAGVPPTTMVTRPRVKRRAPTGQGLGKDGQLLQANVPRLVWAASRPKGKKR